MEIFQNIVHIPDVFFSFQSLIIALVILVWTEALALMETMTTLAHARHHFLESSVKVRNQFGSKSIETSVVLTICIDPMLNRHTF